MIGITSIKIIFKSVSFCLYHKFSLLTSLILNDVLFKAKFCACLFWLIFHATEDGDFGEIPPEITCPTERDPEVFRSLLVAIINHDQ